MLGLMKLAVKNDVKIDKCNVGEAVANLMKIDGVKTFVKQGVKTRVKV